MKKTLARRIVPVALLMATGFQMRPAAVGHPADSAADAGNQQETLPCGSGERGQLIGYQLVASYPSAQSVRDYFDDWIAFYQDYYRFPDLPVAFAHGFDSYKVTYCTVDAVLPGESTAQPAVATGMMSVPRAPGPLSTVAYLHGTSVSFYDAVSNPAISGQFSEAGESFDGPPSNAIFAGAGFIYVGPDYLGLGDSPVPRHRYFHAGTEASAGLDLLVAAQSVLADLGVQQNGRLFTFGFSQGGHAALALHRELQGAAVEVTGTATVGGVFDVEQWFLSSLANERTLTLPLYVSYILVAYDDVYDAYERTLDVFRRPWASRVEGLFDMQHHFDDVVAGLPRNAHALLTSPFQTGIMADPQSSLRVRLRENAVDGWMPFAPLRVYHSPDDEEVPYGDALVSVERLRTWGADVTVEPLPGFDHVNSWIQAMPRAVEWFRSLE